MSRLHHYNKAMYRMMRELAIVRSPTLDTYFKDVLIKPEIKEKMYKHKK